MKEQCIIVELLVDLQYPDWFKKGNRFLMDRETSEIYGFDKLENQWNEYPLRLGLSGYLWILHTEKKFLKVVKE